MTLYQELEEAIRKTRSGHKVQIEISSLKKDVIRVYLNRLKNRSGLITSSKVVGDELIIFKI